MIVLSRVQADKNYLKNAFSHELTGKRMCLAGLFGAAHGAMISYHPRHASSTEAHVCGVINAAIAGLLTGSDIDMPKWIAHVPAYILMALHTADKIFSNSVTNSLTQYSAFAQGNLFSILASYTATLVMAIAKTKNHTGKFNWEKLLFAVPYNVLTATAGYLIQWLFDGGRTETIFALTVMFSAFAGFAVRSTFLAQFHFLYAAWVAIPAFLGIIICSAIFSANKTDHKVSDGFAIAFAILFGINIYDVLIKHFERVGTKLDGVLHPKA